MPHGFILLTQQTDADGALWQCFRHQSGLRHWHKPTSSKQPFCASFIINTPVNDDSGMSHALEHMILRGNIKYPQPNSFLQHRAIANYQHFNASTQLTDTRFHFATTQASTALKLLDFISHSICSPNLKLKDFNHEIYHPSNQWCGVLYNEMQAYMANKEFAQQIELDDQLTQRYPFYGGLPTTISQLNINQLRHYHNRCYRPQYMTLISSGAWSLSSLWQIVAQSLTHLKALQPNTDPKLLFQATTPSYPSIIELGDTLSQQMKWFLYSFLQHNKDAQDWLAQHQLKLVNQPLDLAWITPIRIHSNQKQTIDSSLRQAELLKLLVNSLATQSKAQYHYYLALLGTEYWRQQYQKSGKDLAHLYQQFEQSLNQWQLVQSPDIEINEKQPIAALIQQLTANGFSQPRPKTAVTQLVSGKKCQWLQVAPQQNQLTISSNKPQLIQSMRLYLAQLQRQTQLYCQQQQLASSSHLTQQGGNTSLILICHHQHSEAINGYWLQQLSQTLPLTRDTMPSCHPVQQLIQQTFGSFGEPSANSINLMALVQQQAPIRIQLNQQLIADNLQPSSWLNGRILSCLQQNSCCLGMQLADMGKCNQQSTFATILAKLLMLQEPIQQLRLTGQVYALDYQYDPLQQQLAWYSMIDQAPKLTLEALKQCLTKLFSDKQKHHSQLQLIMPSISINEFNTWLEYQESQLKPNPKGGSIPT